jgi:hypothetical protein
MCALPVPWQRQRTLKPRSGLGSPFNRCLRSNPWPMRHDSAYFRERARDCRDLAKTASDHPTVNLLLQMAEEFEEEARLIERGEPN